MWLFRWNLDILKFGYLKTPDFWLVDILKCGNYNCKCKSNRKYDFCPAQNIHFCIQNVDIMIKSPDYWWNRVMNATDASLFNRYWPYWWIKFASKTQLWLSMRESLAKSYKGTIVGRILDNLVLFFGPKLGCNP